MPIKIQDDLPAKSVLEDERHFRDDGDESFVSGYPSFEDCDSESDADED